MNNNLMLTSLLAFLVALVVAFCMTPPVKLFARKIGAIDVPKDNRRMHKVPIPRVGGLAIFLGFIVSVLIFTAMDAEKKAILLGAVIIVVLGIIDDVVALQPKVKFLGQIVAALVPVLGGVVINRFTNPFSGGYFDLGVLAIPVTIVWIVGITNAVNFIDGLDGLACGVSSIASITMFTIAVLVSEVDIAITMAALVGACFGFMPFNMNPAKIFMGDTGAMFLGYILATGSIQGLFKFYAIISFAVPFIVLGLPIFDTAFAIVRRVAKGQSPLQADRGHLHHRLIDMGFDQKQSVAILYALSLVLGLAAVLLTTSGEAKIIILVFAIFISFMVALNVMRHEKQRREGGNAEETQEEEGETKRGEDQGN